MKQLLRDNFEFLRQFRQRFHTTGAILPSSRFLARALVGPLESRKTPTRLLEIGPGTGAVTRQIVRRLGPNDHFDLVEINETFAELLRERFQKDPLYQSVAQQSHVHVGPLQDFQADQPYDIIISGLPFNNFSAELVGELMDCCFDLLAPGGTFSFFEYMYVRPVRRVLSRGAERKRLFEIEMLMQKHFQDRRFKTNWIFVNIPPAWVQHLRKEPDQPSTEPPA